ncbi:MAG: type 4a pilus biogenesis protein PilO [Acidimicrobiales bacterium]
MNLDSINLSALKRPFVLVTVGALILVAALWWLVWMTPEANKLTTVQAQQTQLQSQLDTLNLTLQLDKKQAAKVNQYAGYLSMFAAAVPPIPEAPQLTTQLANLANVTNVHLTSLSDDTTVPGSPLSTIPITMSVQGPRQSVMAFLQGIYNQHLIARLITVSAFTPTPSGASASANVLKPSLAQYTASITATAYYDPSIDPSASTTATTTTTSAVG